MEVLSKGIDVSSHQGNIDWAKVKAAGVDFAMIRIGFRGYANGIINPDKCFAANIKGASEQGLQIGAYFFSTALTEAEAKEEARYCIDKLKGYEVKLPVVFDFEGYDLAHYRTCGITKEQRIANCKAFNEVISAAGYKSMLYGSKGNIRRTYDIDALNYPLWIAKYAGGYKKILSSDDYFPDMGAYNSRIAMWQYTSIGRVDGISGNVDMNQMYIDLSAASESAPTAPAGKKNTVELATIRKGTICDEVKTLQILLNAYGFKGANGKVLTVDGNAGTNTIYALTAYQAANEDCGSADGICGVKTWATILK